jgi:hypothetical protein
VEEEIVTEPVSPEEGRFLVIVAMLLGVVMPKDRELSHEEARVLGANVARIATALMQAEVIPARAGGADDDGFGGMPDADRPRRSQ